MRGAWPTTSTAEDRRPRRLETFDDRCPKPELAAAVDDLDTVSRSEIVGECTSTVWRRVVHDHELTIEALFSDRRKDRLDEIAESIALVVGRDDDGQGWDRGNGQGMRLQGTILTRTP
jgi:hypothetical protein